MIASKRILTACLVLGTPPISQAGAVIELVPSHGAPFAPGETLTVDIVVRNNDPVDHNLRLIQWDTSDTTQGIVLNPPFEWHSLFSLYNSITRFPRPSVTLTATDIPFARLPALGLFNTGTMSLTLPLESVNHTLDVLNSDETNLNRGAIISFGFGFVLSDPITFWRANTGELTGGVYHFVPEPGTLGLFGVATIIAARFRRRAELRINRGGCKS